MWWRCSSTLVTALLPGGAVSQWEEDRQVFIWTLLQLRGFHLLLHPLLLPKRLINQLAPDSCGVERSHLGWSPWLLDWWISTNYFHPLLFLTSQCILTYTLKVRERKSERESERERGNALLCKSLAVLPLILFFFFLHDDVSSSVTAAEQRHSFLAKLCPTLLQQQQHWAEEKCWRN